MHTFTVLILLALEAYTAVATKVVPLDYVKHRRPSLQELSKHAGYIFSPLGNAGYLYYANITVGTPPQSLQLQVDTGSSDVWMSDSSATYCQQDEDNCQGGTFTPSDSSSYKQVGTTFNITYVDDSNSSGIYFTDDFTIGGITLDGLQMGLATDTSIGTGIIGLSFAADEAVCNTDGPCQEYPSIMSAMVTQGKINSKAYSLWLNDLDAAEGSILFGGVDTDKYHGDLTTLPIDLDANSGEYTSFSVTLTGFSLETTQVTTTYTASDYKIPAILDSGTSLMLLPNSLFAQVQSQMGAEYDSGLGVYVAACSVGDVDATFNFQFGGTSGPTIKVPINEMFEPIYDPEGRPDTLANGDAACAFGMEPAGPAPILFGDTFLRSVYVVYDLDNKQISIAQTNFNSTTSNIEEIKAGVGGIPSASSTATDVTVRQTATSSVYKVVSASGTAVVTSLPTAQLTATTRPTSSSSGAAAGSRVPASNIAGVVGLALSTMASLLGSCFIFL